MYTSELCQECPIKDLCTKLTELEDKYFGCFNEAKIKFYLLPEQYRDEIYPELNQAFVDWAQGTLEYGLAGDCPHYSYLSGEPAESADNNIVKTHVLLCNDNVKVILAVAYAMHIPVKVIKAKEGVYLPASCKPTIVPEGYTFLEIGNGLKKDLSDFWKNVEKANAFITKPYTNPSHSEN